MFRGLASLRQRMQWLDQLGERAISVVHAQRFRDQAARFQAVARTDADGPEQIADHGLTCEHRGDAAPQQTQRLETLLPGGHDNRAADIGRASSRERVWQFVEISVVAVSFKNKHYHKQTRYVKLAES